jgi:hypothetical protein
VVFGADKEAASDHLKPNSTGTHTMKKIFTALLALLAFGPATAEEKPAADPAAASRELRSMVLALSAADLGLTRANYPHRVWGMLMETTMQGGHYTLVALADGSTSLYYSTGGGVIGASTWPAVKDASQSFLDQGNHTLDSSAPATSLEPPPPGRTRFFFLTFDGVQVGTAPEAALTRKNHKLAALFRAGNDVITAIRKATPSSEKETDGTFLSPRSD